MNSTTPGRVRTRGCDPRTPTCCVIYWGKQGLCLGPGQRRHQQDDIRLAVLEIALLALLVPNFSRLELVTYIVIDSLVLGLELEKN
jgi:hypothetical protein